MYTLMIVDDEPLEREAMGLLLRKRLPDIQVCAEAGNGYEALEIIGRCRPDIIFVDINMPGMDGLETIKALQDAGVSCRFIILTSHSRFDYARDALRLGVEDFLLKPADEGTVERTVRRVIESIEQDQDRRRSREELKEQVQDMRPVIEDELIRHVMESSPVPDRLLNLLDLDFASSCVLLIECPYDTVIFEKRLNNFLMNRNCRVLSESRGTQIILLLFSREEGSPFRRTAEDMHREINRSSTVTIACGPPAYTAAELSAVYGKALEVLDYARSTGSRLAFPEDCEGETADQFPVMRYVDLFHAQLLQHDREEWMHTADLFFSDLSARENRDGLRQQTYVYQSALLICQKLSESSGLFFLWEELRKNGNLIPKGEDLPTLKLRFLNFLENMTVLISSGRESRQDSILRDVLQYIRDHFSESVSLEDLADHLKLSASHLSKVVKKSTGRNFPDILNSYRINEAMDLLRKEKLSIKEVTFRVGYNSQHYFSRIFKKQTGFSPSDFRSRRN